MKRTILTGLGLLLASLGLGEAPAARTAHDSHTNPGDITAAPVLCITQHNVGDMVLGVSNNGTFGDYDDGQGPDCFTGAVVRACEFPKGSDSRYLYAGAFWIGAVLGRDTLVSTGADGWSVTGHEFHADVEGLGEMVVRSITDPSKPQYDGAISEQDLIAVYFDTCVANCPGLTNDPVDRRPHRPLHLEVTQRSFAWSYSYAKDFVLFDYAIRNIGINRLRKVYMGIYVDADVYPLSTGNPGAQDDVCGFRRTLPAWYSPTSECQYEDTLNMAWIADNDGDLSPGNASGGVPNVTGTRIVRTPSDSLKVSFNWWVGNGTPALDFGPQGRGTYRTLGTGGIGTPEGDRNKYYFLRNGEFDYDQSYTAVISPADTLWMYPGDRGPTIARSLDTRYLLSFGPFDIEPGQVLPVSFAYVGGRGFHHVENNLNNLPFSPQTYNENLDFSNFGYNSTWSSWIYDTPGYDSDSDEYFGKYHVCVSGPIIRIDTIIVEDPPSIIIDTLFTVEDTTWYEGDGVPDFRGASPPPSPASWSTGSPPIPALRVSPTVGKVLIRFNGLLSETTPDAFSHNIDFEGYRVYCSRDDRGSSYTLLDSYDKEDYNKFVWDPSEGSNGEFVLKDIPYTLRELRCAYATDSCDDASFNPLVYSRSNPFRVPGFPDSLIYFVPQDFNRSVLGVSTGIRKRFPGQPYPVSLNKDSCLESDTTVEGFFKYFEYEYAIDNLLPTVRYFINVTAFDFGSPSSGLPSLESERTLRPAITYALESQDSVQAKNLKIAVYPNPYRIEGNYAGEGYEGTTLAERAQVPDRNRRIHFYNLPPVCTIRIYTLDGDLVRELTHSYLPTDPLSTHETWDLITRNTQLAVSGLYYWTVESPDGSVQIGKLVLIM